jgi:hypothetical protein
VLVKPHNLEDTEFVTAFQKAVIVNMAATKLVKKFSTNTQILG